MTADTIAAVVNLLNGLVNFWLNAILSTQQQGQVGSRPITRMGSRPVSRAGYRTDDSVDTARYSFNPESFYLIRPKKKDVVLPFTTDPKILKSMVGFKLLFFFTVF